MITFAPRSSLLLVLAALTFAACERPLELDTDTTTSPVIYGTDDRADWYASPLGWQQLMSDSMVVLVNPNQVDQSNPGDVQLLSSTLGQDLQLCAGQRFADQIDPGMCSATLIDDDLILTAGHCLDSSRLQSCTYRFVFNFYMTSATQPATITSDDVYSCRAIAVRQLTDTAAGSHDFAIIQLDRPATPRHQPAPVRAALTALAQGSGVNLMGFPEGIPAKFAPGASVVTPRAQTLDYFEANIDSFEGNSGSGVFDNAGRVVGIAVSGQNDWDVRGNCQIANTLPNDGSQGLEQISYAADAIRALCQANWPSARLCGATTCGDGRCDTSELAACPQDCAVLDGGVLPDGGPVPDAGFADSGVARDAGFADSGVARDAGVRDGGVRDGGLTDSGLTDSGSVVVDAGGVSVDAGSSSADAGASAQDASAPRDGSVRPSGLVTDRSSGCTCTTERGGPGLGALLLFVGLGLVFARRPRR